MVLAPLSLAAAVPFAVLSWANFIEPNWLRTSSIVWKLPKKHAHLHGMRIVQISDLHCSKSVPKKFLKKVAVKIAKLSPDILLFSGDFICRAQVGDHERLESFLNSLHAPLGVYAILGNHDYQSYISRNIQGKIDVISMKSSQPFKRAFVSLAQGLFGSNKYNYAEGLQKQEPNEELLRLLKNTPVRLLHNESHLITDVVNIVGLGDLFAKQFDPKKAFTNYNPSLPGIILSHNPDTVYSLEEYPGDLIFSGHTHGSQVSIPWPKFANRIMNRTSGLENPHLIRGHFLLSDGRKQLFVNRGLGGFKRLRFCSPPEICCVRCVYEH
ncbi:UDP-2,3-diacylglucosamine diphosphatase LpxG [Chlamydia vaughanii]|uniref:UDP-2,3-diacylglucosamine diphosphatase LpxG n=1 Tax=Chlamydia vaughanii TaxID=3112552 RepID=UPI0032B22A51